MTGPKRAFPVDAAAQRLQGDRHGCVEGLEATVPAIRTPDLAHVIPVDHEGLRAGQTLGSLVLLNKYRDAGMDRTVLLLPTAARDETLKSLDGLVTLTRELRS